MERNAGFLGGVADGQDGRKLRGPYPGPPVPRPAEGRSGLDETVAHSAAGGPGAAENAFAQGAAPAYGVEVRAARKRTGIDAPCMRVGVRGAGEPAVYDTVGKVARVEAFVGASWAL